jgi:thymidylate kinase
MSESDLRVGLVGPCKSGKSVLKTGLEKAGYRNIRHIAQEHSFAPRMWRLIGKPDVLIFLDVSYKETLKRGKLNWQPKDLAEQHRRLADAREHADLIIDTSDPPPEAILQAALDFLRSIP